MFLAFRNSRKITKCESKVTETDKMTIISTKKQPDNISQLEKTVSLFKIISLICFVIALITLSVFMYYDNMAKRYGAYGDYYKSDSINDIKHNAKMGFIDQSEELPEDLRGCIIVYIKYGCIDCEEIHDGITSYIKDNDVKNIYFVSTRSAKGKELLE